MDIDYNTHCYKFEKNNYEKGILDNSVDATYIIHLKDNGRLNHIQEQLKEYQPTKTVYIVFNQGFKKCEKKLIEQVSYQDLTDAFLQCFKHANEHNYDNVLILEDDFIFNPKIKDEKNITCVNDFLNKKKNEEFIYYLGCNPIIIVTYSYNLKQYKSYKSCSMHAIIYSKKARNKTLNLQLKHWDVIIENGIPNRYLYYIPLCYQTYPNTENKLTWSNKDNVLVSYSKNAIISFLNLDVSPEPGFSIIYFISKMLCSITLIVIFIILLYILYSIIYANYKNNNKKSANRKIKK